MIKLTRLIYKRHHPFTPGSLSRHQNDALSLVASQQHVQQRLTSILQSLRHLFAILQLAIGDELRYLFVEAVEIGQDSIENSEAVNGDTAFEDESVAEDGMGCAVVARDRATNLNHESELTAG